MARIGEVHEKEELDEFVIEWKIQNFLELSEEVHYSPTFSFANAYWCLSVYPNGGGWKGWINIFLQRETYGPPIKLEYTLGLKTEREKLDFLKTSSYHFQDIGLCHFAQFLRKSEILEKKSEILPLGTLSVVCRLKAHLKAAGFTKAVTTKCCYCRVILDSHEEVSSHLQKCREFPTKCPRCNDLVVTNNWYDHRCHKADIQGYGKAAPTKCFYCNLDLDEEISYHLQKCTELPIKCPKCGDVVALRNWHDHKCCQTTGADGTEKLLNDFKSLLLSGDHSDTIVKVKKEDFKLHKSILVSRSPYFCSLYSGMKKKNAAPITIYDCEPDVFRTLMHFVYTGKVDKLTLENVCDLFELAKKCQEDQLKNECLHFMMSAFSVDNFCDFIVLAFKHDEKEMLENAAKFLAGKTKEIIRSVKWQTLLKEYPTQANELLIKALN